MTPSPPPAVLLVDDEETIRSFIRKALARDGFEVVPCGSLAEARSCLEAREFDLLVLDKNLPDGSGLEIIEESRRRGHTSEAIIVTGYSDAESAIQAVALGVFRYVRKPFDIDTLRLDVQGALRTRGLRLDLARRKQALEQANVELSAALERMRESETRRHQSERLATIGYLAAGVVHEINNPLTLLSMAIPQAANELRALGASLALAGDAATRAALEHVTRSLAPAEEAVELLMRLATDLHTLGRTEQHEMRPVRIAEAARSAVRLVRHLVKAKAGVVVEIPDELTVMGRGGRLTQIFINLLTNAARAIRVGGPADNTIAIRAHAQGDHVVIEVSDTGVGIAPGDLARIFEPFFTGARLEGQEGTGIGLALVREFIAEHGGEISVRSAPGHGTVFTITLPTTRVTPTPAILIPSMPAELPAGRKTILFCDLDRSNLTLFDESIGQLHEVLLAATAEEAECIAAARHADIDAIVCEMLPRDHPQSRFLAEVAKRWPPLRRRVIFVSEPGERARAAAAMGLKVLEKPVRPANLLAEVCAMPARTPEG
jgi:two-component system, NtrC family, sensor kinase